MKKSFKSKNGEYFGLTKKEALWLIQNEKKLPQIVSKKENLIFVDLRELEKLL